MQDALLDELIPKIDMKPQEFEDLCYAKVEELLEQYFPNFIADAAVNRPESLDERYTNDIPDRIKTDFLNWLSEVWPQVGTDKASFIPLLDRWYQLSCIDNDFKSILDPARKEAEMITLWERITHTNHEDVTYYKGLLRQYSREMLHTIIRDILEEL